MSEGEVRFFHPPSNSLGFRAREALRCAAQIAPLDLLAELELYTGVCWGGPVLKRIKLSEFL